MRRSTIALAASVLAGLFLTGCPEKGKEMMEEAREAHEEAVNEVGGAPKRQIDHTVNRVGNSLQKGADRLDDVVTE